MIRALPALVTLVTLAACESGDPTEILLTVQSDLIVSDDPAVAEMDTVRVRILRLEPARDPDPDAADRALPPPTDVDVGTPITVGENAYTFRWAHDFALSERALPIEIGTAPEGADASRVALFEAYALRAGAVVVSARARAGYVDGRVVRILLTLNALCRDAECPADSTCQDGECVPIDRECFSDCDAGVDASVGLDASVAVDGGGPALDGAVGTDTGPPIDTGTPCDPAACDDGDRCNGIEGCVGGRCAPGVPLVCDDGVACTADSCRPVAGCVYVADDSRCAAMSSGRCDPMTGCQYPSCTDATCAPGPCETARCAGDVCERTFLCRSGQMCCGGACVTMGCNDGNPCTDDSCGATGCRNVANTSPCDDGRWCTGADTCAAGSCSAHSGSPCGARACYEASDTCAECAIASDCGATTYGPFGACDYAGTCDESAQQTRMVQTPQCTSGVCGISISTETRACARDTDGTSCGSNVNGPWGPCSYTSTCDETGTRSRTVTSYLCGTGTCRSSTTTQNEVGGACARPTDGTVCDDGTLCTENDQCFGGTCMGAPCFITLTCGMFEAPSCTPGVGCECIPF